MFKLAQTRLKEMQQEEEINEVAKLQNIEPDKVELTTVASHYESLKHSPIG